MPELTDGLLGVLSLCCSAFLCSLLSSALLCSPCAALLSSALLRRFAAAADSFLLLLLLPAEIDLCVTIVYCALASAFKWQQAARR